MRQSIWITKAQHEVTGVVDDVVVPVRNEIEAKGSLRILLEKRAAESIRF